MIINDLKNEWQALNRRLGSKPAPAGKVLAELLAAYSGPKRHYHSLEHIRNLLEITEQNAGRLKAPDTIRAAVWFHDAVYEAFRSDNEEKSAEFARISGAKLGWKPAFCEKTAVYILATRKHKPSHDPDLQFLLDADLSILAADRPIYDRYAADVRKEYASVPTLFYKAGRKKVLRKFLEKKQIFYFFPGDFESRARENIRRELAAL